MVGLLNPQTGLIEDVPEGQASDAIASGQYQFPEGKPITLVSPETGTSLTGTDPQKAKDLLSAGMQFETKDQLLKRTIKTDPDIQGTFSGPALAFGNQLANSAFLGLPQAVQENVGDKTQKKITRGVNEELRNEYPLSTIAGGVIGTATTLLATPIGKGLGLLGDTAAEAITGAASLGGESAVKTAVSKLAATGVKYGTENAALNIPQRVTEEVLGDPNIASEGISALPGDLLTGGEFGVGTSVFGSVLKLGSKIASKTVGPEKLQYLSDKALAKSIGFQTSEFKKISDITGKENPHEALGAMRDIIEGNVDEYGRLLGATESVPQLQTKLEEAENHLTEIRTATDAAMEAPISHSRITNGVDEVEKSFSKGNLNVPAKAGEKPFLTEGGTPGRLSVTDQEMVSSIYGSNPQNWPPDVIEAIQNGKPVPGIETPGTPAVNTIAPKNESELKAISLIRKEVDAFVNEKLQAEGFSDAQINEMKANGQYPSYGTEDIHNLRQRLKGIVDLDNRQNNSSNSAGRAVWHAFGQIIDDTVNQVAEKTGDANLLNSFKPANKTYSQLRSTLEKLLEPAAFREQARNSIGIGTKILSAGLGGPGALIGAGLQHGSNYAAYRTLGFAAKTLEGVTNVIDKSIDGFLSGKLSSISGTEAKEAAILGSVKVWSEYTKDPKTSPKEAFPIIQNDLRYLSANPDAISQSLDTYLPTASQFMPQNYALIGSAMQNATKYLQDSAPQPPDSTMAGLPPRPWQPTDNELSKYSRRLNAVFNPLSILTEVKTGTLTKESVEAVKTVYPNLFQAIQQKIQEKLSSAPPAQVYKIRSKLRLLLPDTEDPQAKAVRIQGLQGGFLPNNNHVTPLANSKITEDKRFTTDINRISNE